MLRITSRDNKKLKNVRKVRDGRVSKFIFIEGVRLAQEALKSDLKLSEVFVSESFYAAGKSLLKKFDERQTYIVPDKIFNSITATKSSQGIVLIAEKPENDRAKIESKFYHRNQRTHLILLHEINNPSNLGAILRTAEAAGVAGIITTKHSATVFSNKALRSAMGAGFRLPVWENAEFGEVINWAKSNDLKTVCADINAEKSYQEIDWSENFLIVFGSEAHGLKTPERNLVDESIFIPMENDVESLNLAVACGIILFEAKKTSLSARNRVKSRRF